MMTRSRLGLGVVVAMAALLLAGLMAAHGQDMKAKAERGFANMVGGVVEVPGMVTETTRKEGPWKGFTVGFLKGLIMVPVRTAVGVYELLTFYVPAPTDYEPVLTPATAFNYWDAD